MDNLEQLLNLIFGQQMSPIVSNNPALRGMTPNDLASGQDLTGVLSPSLFSRAAVPSLIGGSLLSAFPGTIPRAAGAGLSAIGLLSALTK